MEADCIEQFLQFQEQVMRGASKKNHKKGSRAPARADVSTVAAAAPSSGGAATSFTPDPMAMYQALEAVTPMLRGVTRQSLVPIRLDCPTIAMRLLNRLRVIEPYRATIAILPLVRQDWLANLESIALALIHVDSLSKITVREPPAVKAMFKEASRHRDSLRDPIAVLQRDGIVPKAALAKQEGKRGYTQTAKDLVVLGNLLRDNWETITGRTTITMDDVNRATTLAQVLFRNAESRNKRATIPEDLVHLKKQAYTLFLLAYDELRRCLEFIEKGAADRIAPTLYEGRGRKPGTKERKTS